VDNSFAKSPTSERGLSRNERERSRFDLARAMMGGSGMKRILVCLDTSPRAPSVLAAARDLAVRAGAKLVLFRSVGLPPELDKEFLAMSPNDVAGELMSRAKRELASLAGDAPPETIDSVHVRVGTPWDAICTEARELDCDLIVIGSHGYSGLDRLLGTTAAKVVNHADRSVLVVRPPA
jgi:nucleotide-binding universal stress UspA family protein